MFRLPKRIDFNIDNVPTLEELDINAARVKHWNVRVFNTECLALFCFLIMIAILICNYIDVSRSTLVSLFLRILPLLIGAIYLQWVFQGEIFSTPVFPSTDKGGFAHVMNLAKQHPAMISYLKNVSTQGRDLFAYELTGLVAYAYRENEQFDLRERAIAEEEAANIEAKKDTDAYQEFKDMGLKQ